MGVLANIWVGKDPEVHVLCILCKGLYMSIFLCPQEIFCSAEDHGPRILPPDLRVFGACA